MQELTRGKKQLLKLRKETAGSGRHGRQDVTIRSNVFQMDKI